MASINEPRNYHCSIINVSGFGGLLIRGKSGSGKTSLALGLLENLNCHTSNNSSAHFICDDQAMLEVNDETLIATVPEAIKGKVEIYGFGIVEIDCKTTSKIKLIIDLVEYKLIERMPEKELCEILGIKIPNIKVPKKHEAQAIRIIKAWLLKNTACLKQDKI